VSGNLWIKVFLPFAAGYYLSYLLRTVNAVIAPELTRELTLTAADLGLLTSAYLLAFAAFQIPLGLLLDRYGPRRVEAGLLLVAAAGTLLFAFGRSPFELTLARGLIGLGVSSCLMAAFKGFAQNFPAERQASLTGAIMASGGLGAITASLPLEFALPLFGWRGVFQGLTFLLLAVAALDLLLRAAARGGRLARQPRRPAEGRRRHPGAPRLLALRAADGPRHRRLPGGAGPVGRALADERRRADAPPGGGSPLRAEPRHAALASGHRHLRRAPGARRHHAVAPAPRRLRPGARQPGGDAGRPRAGRCCCGSSTASASPAARCPIPCSRRTSRPRSPAA
jgi:MFS family permease